MCAIGLLNGGLLHCLRPGWGPGGARCQVAHFSAGAMVCKGAAGTHESLPSGGASLQGMPGFYACKHCWLLFSSLAVLSDMVLQLAVAMCYAG
eukprot:1157694-Pelagomonas_calceolata.AAC.16